MGLQKSGEASSTSSAFASVDKRHQLPIVNLTLNVKVNAAFIGSISKYKEITFLSYLFKVGLLLFVVHSVTVAKGIWTGLIYERHMVTLIF